MADMQELEVDIEGLLADPVWQGHPLHHALGVLMERHRDLLRQLERITHIADRYQGAEHERGMSYCQRYEKQLHQLERLLRISDRYQQIMRRQHEELRQQSTHDPLTGLYNRRYMQRRLHEEALKLGRHQDQLFSVVLADIDHFKAVNDTFGHNTGDAVLMEVARRFVLNIRKYDVCGRWGGEEFLLLLPSTTEAQAYRVCENLRRVISETQYRGTDGQSLAVSMSFGYGSCRAVEDLENTLKKADSALYDAKRTGRNRVSPVIEDEVGTI
jgi:diguanylate cyclase (GGDEF)-like protein